MDRHETRIQQPHETPDPDGVYERYCPQCGRSFICWEPREWCYQRNRRIFCSWRCYREDLRGLPPHRGVDPARVLEDVQKPHTTRKNNTLYNPEQSIEQTKKIIPMKQAGMNNKQIAAVMGLSPAVVAQRLTKWGRALGWQPKTKREAAMEGVAARKKKRGKG